MKKSFIVIRYIVRTFAMSLTIKTIIRKKEKTLPFREVALSGGTETRSGLPFVNNPFLGTITHNDWQQLSNLKSIKYDRLQRFQR